MTPGEKKDLVEEYEDLREKIEQEIRDTDKQIQKMTKRKAELEEMLKNTPKQG